MHHHTSKNMYMKQDRATDEKDVVGGASAQESVESTSGGLNPPVPGGDLNVVLRVEDVEPGALDCPAVLQTTITIINNDSVQAMMV